MNSKILNTIANAIDNREEIKRRTECGKEIFKELQTCVDSCQSRFGGRSELATEDDIRVVNLCEKWEKILSHGLRSNLSGSSLQNIVSAGLNFSFNIINVGNSLWSYSCLHLTKHEKERFKILSNINTPLGYFRAFLRAALNERSLLRYIQSWISHGLLTEYYDDGAFLRSQDANTLPSVTAGLSTVLFALSIDRPELNESQPPNQINKVELVIPLPTPIKSNGNSKRRPLRQVISFDNEKENKEEIKDQRRSLEPIPSSAECSWNSAPATCLNSPDSKLIAKGAPNSEPTSSDYKSIRHFFPDSVKSIDSPLQILSKLSESAKEIFSSSQSSIDKNILCKEDDLSVNCLKISESDSEGVAESIDSSTSCLELCFTEEEVPDERSPDFVLESREKEFVTLQIKYNQSELASKQKTEKLEKIILDLRKENDNLKEQLKKYMSALELGVALKGEQSVQDNLNDDVNVFERKLVQVAEMHAELMEFNQHLQKRLHDFENSSIEILTCPESNVKACIPAAFLVGKKPNTYHTYQIFLKVGQEEWNVYHRYAKFYELHSQLKKCHPDIANYKFPPKKTLQKRRASVVENRRAALQAYLRHILLALPELRDCTSRAQLVTLLPFFGTSSTTTENSFNRSLSRQNSSDTVTFDVL